MKHKIWFFGLVILFTGCKSNPNKVEEVQTQLEKPAAVSGSQQIGVKNDLMVVQDKREMTERLRDLQNSVFALEDKVYGTRKLGSLGLYGELKGCRRKLASKQYGGSGTLLWSEPLDRVTDKEEELKIGVDEKKDLVGMSEEGLRDRVRRFQGYKAILQKRADDFEEKIEACNTEAMAKQVDTSAPAGVLVKETPKPVGDRAAVNDFMCGFVRPGASLQGFMINAFAHGWLSISDFQMSQNLLAGPVKDVKGDSRDHAFLFNGWKMAFDSGPVTVGDVLNHGKDARMQAWTYDHKSEVASAPACLPSPDGVWNK